MPTLTDKSGPAAVTDDRINIPPSLPSLPQDVKQRFPSMADWEAQMEQWYKGLAIPLQDLATDTSSQALFFPNDAESTVTLAGIFVVDQTNAKAYIGAGNYGMADTAFYVDSLGRLSLKDLLKWDGRGTLTLKDGVIDVGTLGAVRGGQTAYDTGVGFWLGYESAKYKLSLGDPSGAFLTWDGTSTLSIKNGSIDVGTAGNIHGGQSAFLTGVGFYLGYGSGAYQLSIGDPAGAYLAWDGTNLIIAGGIIVYSTAPVSLSPAGQLFTPTITVVASCANGAATILYTTDGTDVTSTSPAFPGGGLTLSSTTTLKARAFVGNLGSAQVSQTYTINNTTAKVASPSISFNPENFTTFSPTAACTITCGTAGASIFYQVNGGGYGAYGGTFTANALDQIDAYATHGADTQSDVSSRMYENNV